MNESQGRTTLEALLADVEQRIDGLTTTSSALGKELKKARSAAASGALRDLARALNGAAQLASALGEAVAATAGEWQFDEREYLASGAYAEELARTAAAAGVMMLNLDGRLMTYPSVIRPVPADAVVEIDRKREKGIRPSHVLKLIQARRDRPVRFKPEAFLESLYRCYELILPESNRRTGATVGLQEVYRLLTLMPGQSSEYSEQEFLRDIYLLESSGVERTKGGLRVSFPAATGTKGARRLVTVTREGDERLYYGIAFRQ